MEEELRNIRETLGRIDGRIESMQSHLAHIDTCYSGHEVRLRLVENWISGANAARAVVAGLAGMGGGLVVLAATLALRAMHIL